ncbi:sensor domain-containing diguanylate cyclase [Bacillus tuaregi]|uniref:sensor domain-containing diguanylate cyclase n=1 Tax=Bacillus tuaregi TaxID=1816695 RepID=UPI0008F7FD6B|nr:sensor domain-containing diguanylate cyclase [Bacillus tuaregi]
MAFTRKNVLILTYVLFTLAFATHSYLLIGKISITTMIIYIFILTFLWLLWKKQELVYQEEEKQREEIQRLEIEAYRQRMDVLEKENEKLSQNIRLIEQNLDNITDIAIFSFDVTTNKIYISKGAEHIFGYTHQELMSNPHLWRHAVHHEDIAGRDEKDQRLLSGEMITSEYRVVLSNGDTRWVIQREIPIKNELGEVIRVQGNVIDISDRKKLEFQLKQMAYYDDLTNLANRSLMERQLKKSLARSKRQKNTLGIMFVDLDGFKKVNDTMGHEIGDLLLKEVANRLNDSVREEDFIARLGGDEFLIVFEATNQRNIEKTAERLLDEISQSYQLNGKLATVTPSIGISLYPKDGKDQDTLINNADKAMYYAKSQGKANFQFYRPELEELLAKKPNVFQKIVTQLFDSRR